MSRALAVGIDAGGTKVAGLLVEIGEDVKILDRRVAPAPAADVEAMVETIVSVGKDWVRRQDVEALGVGAAGMVDLEGVMRYAPNIAWSETPLSELLGKAMGRSAYVDNDANVAAWGEFRFGAGRHVDDMLLVTVGTGIGGGIVSGGKLFRGAHGFAAEIGHIIVEPDGPQCGCGNLGCWEQVASGRAIGRLGREAVRESPPTLILELSGGDPDAVTGLIVTEAARRGDAIAVRILAQVGRRLGEGIAGLVNILDPHVVVIGGGVADAGELLLEPARRAFAESVEAPDHRPPVPMVVAALGNDAGAVGAADLALTHVGGRR